MADEPCYAGNFDIHVQSLVSLCFCFLYTCRQKSLYLSLSEHEQLNSELSCLESDVMCLLYLSAVEYFSDCHSEAFAIHSLVCSYSLRACRLKILHLSLSEHEQLNSEVGCLESDVMCLWSILCLSAAVDCFSFAMHSLVFSWFLQTCRLKSLHLSLSEQEQLNSELSCLESDVMCLQSILC